MYSSWCRDCFWIANALRRILSEAKSWFCYKKLQDKAEFSDNLKPGIHVILIQLKNWIIDKIIDEDPDSVESVSLWTPLPGKRKLNQSSYKAK